MLSLYLPVAQLAVNPIIIVIMGFVVGILSGLFGVGGGFLTTPLLIFYGIPPGVAVASASVQVAGSSTTSMISHLKRSGVDIRLGMILVVGGFVGAWLGSLLMKFLQARGQADFTISVAYVVLLGAVGGLMLQESLRTLFRRQQIVPKRKRPSRLVASLPYRMRFPLSGIYISPIGPLAIGAGVGALTSIMGVGGGFIMIPALVYILRVNPKVVVGTSAFQIVWVASAATLLQAINNKTVDIVLALLLLGGGVYGARIGAAIAQQAEPDRLRLLLAVIILAVAIRLLLNLTWRPDEAFTVYPA